MIINTAQQWHSLETDARFCLLEDLPQAVLHGLGSLMHPWIYSACTEANMRQTLVHVVQNPYTGVFDCSQTNIPSTKKQLKTAVLPSNELSMSLATKPPYAGSIPHLAT